MKLSGFVRRGDLPPCRSPRRQAELARRGRRAHLEQLESRTLLAALPFGAMPDDTGEYMLGDVAVTVVLMESDPSMGPSDNLPAPQGRNAPVEDWTPASIAAVKTKIETALQWWEDTLDALPNVRDGLLDFKIDWTYLNNPVHTGYEPIDRPSNDFALWIYDFLQQVGFNHTGDFSADIRAYNDFKRQQVFPGQDFGADWGFTIFVVNNANDADGFFNTSGSFKQAFSYAGGRFMVVPASRPASTFAHETGHEFWALDEYLGGSTYTARRGYYNNPNTNSADNPTPGFVQANSIMANDTPQPKLTNAYLAHTSSSSSLQMIGWKDSDGDGIFDVLDVPFSLSGFGSYSSSSGQYTFSGSASVKTLPNRNSSGLQNDITINQIKAIQMSLDNGAWTTVKTFAARTYATDFTVAVPAPAGGHSIKFRAIDTRTGVTSPEFVGNTSEPATAPLAGISGFVFADSNSNGTWDANEAPLPAYTVNLLDQNDVPVDLHHEIEPNAFAQEAILNNVQPGVLLEAIDESGFEYDVFARTSTIVPAAGKVFGNYDPSGNQPTETWTEDSRKLKVTFSAPVGNISIQAYNGGASLAGFGRIEAYNAQGQLLDRFTSGAITGSAAQTLSISRAASDIAYVIVKAHAGSTLVLDSLAWGTPSAVAIDEHGAYSFPYLPAGTYHVQPQQQPGYTVTAPAGGFAPVTVVAGQSAGNINFGLHFSENIWHNFALPWNVDGDSQNQISPIDALLIINWLNANPDAPQLPQNGSTSAVGYIDVNNDGYCGPIDALLVINFLNASAGGGGGEGETATFQAHPTTSSAGQTDQSPIVNEQSGGEGEEPAPPQTAAEYYSRNPIQIRLIRGTDQPCTCAQCLAVRDTSLQAYVAASRTSASESDLELIAADISQAAAKRRK